MTNDEIIQIARRSYKSCEHIPNVKIPPEFIERFANLVAQQAQAEEREACAKVCDDRAFRFFSESPFFVEIHGLADAIRARGQA
jgi:hypothetical protein